MGNTTKARILIVEDEAIVAADLKALVNKQGYEICGVISTAGMGMGLPISYSIIINHHGHISVESQMGIGTTFHVHLPAHK